MIDVVAVEVPTVRDAPPQIRSAFAIFSMVRGKQHQIGDFTFFDGFELVLPAKEACWIQSRSL